MLHKPPAWSGGFDAAKHETTTFTGWKFPVQVLLDSLCQMYRTAAARPSRCPCSHPLPPTAYSTSKPSIPGTRMHAVLIRSLSFVVVDHPHNRLAFGQSPMDARLLSLRLLWTSRRIGQ